MWVVTRVSRSRHQPLPPVASRWPGVLLAAISRNKGLAHPLSWQSELMSLESSLTGRTVLVVEDDPFIGLDIADTLRRAGAVVAGPTPRLSRALQLVEEIRLDAAVIDMRLERATTIELADRLIAARIPFLFQTSDPSAIPAAYAGVPVLRKPFRGDQLIAALHDLLAKP